MMGVSTPPKHRRRWTAEQKLAIVRESFAPGKSVAIVAREHGVNSRQLFQWRKLYQQQGAPAITTVAKAVAAPELASALGQVRKLQRLLRQKTRENEVLREAVEYGRANRWPGGLPLPSEDD
ncbi:hypothetical protein BTH42_07575 [Burkholderia sp. SRS-W-2-2016]|nr:hypothetical protein BTH42_07575 [Burkholderia sp. SRS-W-2-2016]